MENLENTPAGRVPPALLQHIHLVSSYNYPIFPQINTPLEAVAKFLIEAPKITRDLAPMNWQFLDAPPDGTMILEWQPMRQASTDGYVWGDVEQVYTAEVRGYVMEVYTYACGYQLHVDSIAQHARKRYRLVSATNPNPNLPAADPSLWIIHYGRSEERHQLPSNRIPVHTQAQAMIAQREILRRHGQLLRKEFMLYDRNNWPTVNMPNNAMPGQSWPTMAYPNNVMSQMGRNQHSYMTPQQVMNQSGMGPSPAKRPRQMGPNHAHGPNRAAPQVPQTSALDDEDIVSGDIMDTLTPRDISSNRYMQHHEWMEEVFSSPYGTSQIVPVELGLGRKGEIESLTRDFFNAPTSEMLPSKDSAAIPRVGRLEPDRAEDFSQQATRRVGLIHAEMEGLKRQHARRMTKLNNGHAIKEAEQKLRTLGGNGLDKNGPNQIIRGRPDGVDDFLGNVETELGRSIKVFSEISCIQKGGLVEKSQVSDAGLRSFDFEEMANFSDHPVQSTSHPTPQATSSRGYGSTGHTPHEFTIQPPMTGDGAQEDEEARVLPSDETTMGKLPSHSATKDTESGDWIMVEKEGAPNGQDNQATPDVESMMNDAALEGDLGTPGHDLDTAGEALQAFAPDTAVDPSEEFNPNDFGDTVDFGSLDTAGEALSGYGDTTELGLDEHGDLNMDDSAFGEAFHATEPLEEHEKTGPEP